MYVCVYVYIHIYTHIHIYICIYIYIYIYTHIGGSIAYVCLASILFSGHIAPLAELLSPRAK